MRHGGKEGMDRGKTGGKEKQVKKKVKEVKRRDWKEAWEKIGKLHKDIGSWGKTGEGMRENDGKFKMTAVR